MSKGKPEPRALPRKFYERAAFDPKMGSVVLDGKVLKTQAKKTLYVAQQKLGDAIAEEWNAQAGVINPDLMPLTRLINITIDRVPEDRLQLIEQLCAYGETDLLCYRNEGELGARQTAAFEPLLAWVKKEFGLTFHVTDGLMPIAQPTESLHALSKIFAAANDGELAALAMLAPMLGSALLALALWKEKVTCAEALRLCRLDEDFQAEKWGADAEAVAAWDGKRRDIQAAAFFLDMQVAQ